MNETTGVEVGEAAALLAAELRRHRLESGHSLRSLAKALRTGVSTLVDYEKGRRIPPEQLAVECEKIFDVEEGVLRKLRTQALADRARTAQASRHEPTPESAERPEYARRPFPALLQRRSLQALLAGLIGALVGAVVTGLVVTGLVVPGTPAATKTVAVARVAGSQVKDNVDPQDAGCDRDAVDAATVTLAIPAGNFVVGQDILRYSPECHAAWTRFNPTPVLDRVMPHSHLALGLERPVDHQSIDYGTDYEGAFSWGNLLLTTPGCVTATITVTAPHKTPVTATTGCVTPAAH